MLDYLVRNKMKDLKIKIPTKEIGSFCKKWNIKELALFGSVLRDDFDLKKSDIDILIEFLPGVYWGWKLAEMKRELEALFNRPVDFVSKRAIERSRNPYRKKEILSSYEVIYEQAA